MTKVVVILIALGLWSLTSSAQKAFEGRIIYDVAYNSFPDGMESVEQSLPQQVVMIIKGQNVRIIQQSALAGELLQIHRSSIDSIYQIFHFMDRNVLMVEPIENKSIKYRVVEMEERKELAGVQGQKMFLQSADGQHVDAWVDAKFQNHLQADLSGLKYLPLEYSIVKNGISMTLFAREIKHEPIDQTYFMLPENVVRIKGSDLQRILN